MEEKTKTLTLKFLRSELLNDLDGYGFVEGDVMRDDAEHLKHGRHQTMDITQDGNINLVTRHLDLALSWCRERLYPYSKSAVGDGVVMDDVLTNTDTYIITLKVPDDFSQSTAEHLEQLIHNILVYYALWHWLSITKPEGSDKWIASANSLIDEVKGALARRCGKVYRRRSPFDSGTTRR